jgi:hypothetical protein
MWCACRQNLASCFFVPGTFNSHAERFPLERLAIKKCQVTCKFILLDRTFHSHAERFALNVSSSKNCTSHVDFPSLTIHPTFDFLDMFVLPLYTSPFEHECEKMCMRPFRQWMMKKHFDTTYSTSLNILPTRSNSTYSTELFAIYTTDVFVPNVILVTCAHFHRI